MHIIANRRLTNNKKSLCIIWPKKSVLPVSTAKWILYLEQGADCPALRTLTQQQGVFGRHSHYYGTRHSNVSFVFQPFVLRPGKLAHQLYGCCASVQPSPDPRSLSRTPKAHYAQLIMPNGWGQSERYSPLSKRPLPKRPRVCLLWWCHVSGKIDLLVRFPPHGLPHGIPHVCPIDSFTSRLLSSLSQQSLLSRQQPSSQLSIAAVEIAMRAGKSLFRFQLPFKERAPFTPPTHRPPITLRNPPPLSAVQARDCGLAFGASHQGKPRGRHRHYRRPQPTPAPRKTYRTYTSPLAGSPPCLLSSSPISRSFSPTARLHWHTAYLYNMRRRVFRACFRAFSRQASRPFSRRISSAHCSSALGTLSGPS